jgi:predicted PhzF superfamily epimerase YddE/YHI9
MAERLFQVDAFSERPFGGNPAAVCLLTEPRPEPWMQAVAGFQLRWFTPVVEVDLCGPR